jgi:hypothetical protein
MDMIFCSFVWSKRYFALSKFGIRARQSCGETRLQKRCGKDYHTASERRKDELGGFVASPEIGAAGQKCKRGGWHRPA